MALRSASRPLRTSPHPRRFRVRASPSMRRRQGLWRLAWSLPFALAALLGLILAFHLQAAQPDGEAIFDANCAGCHESGRGPQRGDIERLARLYDQGVETLYANALNGTGGMPARGGNAALSDDEVFAAVDYLFRPITAQSD
ncbi:c-type cytochrome [Halotalea alkalilenta]|nr:c-type cytochrome [Halotalea alkalilenta]